MPILDESTTIVQAGEAYTVVKHVTVCFDHGPCTPDDDDDTIGVGISLAEGGISSGGTVDTPCDLGSCDPFPNDGMFTYIYTLENQGPLPVIGFEVLVSSANVSSAGFIFGPGVNPSATNIEPNRVEWKFFSPVLAAGQTSDQLYIVSPLGPDLVGVSVHGAGGLDTPAENFGPAVVCKICEGGDGDDDSVALGEEEETSGSCFICPSGPGAAPLAATVSFDIDLFGAEVSPPVNTSGWGTATITVDLNTNVVSITGAFNDLGGPATGVSLRGDALPGETAPVIIGLTFDPATNGSFSGSGVASLEQLDSILDGHSYVDVVSTVHPGGEIRAQVTSDCPDGDDDDDAAGLSLSGR